MTITLQEVKKVFNEYNKKVFNGGLPEPSFELMHTKTILGQFCPRNIGNDKMAYLIRVSTYYDRPYKSYVDTIVHEMLHYYIKYNNIKDRSSHGPVWKRMAKEISNKYGLTITRTNPIGGGVSEAVIKKKTMAKNKHEYVMVCALPYKSYGAIVIPADKLDWSIKRMEAFKSVKTFKVVLAPWSETFDLKHMRSKLSLRRITEKRYNDFMTYKDIRDK